MQTIEQRLATAIRLHQSGRTAEADALYRGILQEQPQHPEALHMLGMLAHQAGRHEDAGALIRQALAIRGPFALYHANLGGVYLALGRFSEAVEECRQAVRLEPRSADFQNKLGIALRRQGKLDEAAACFVEALRLDEFLIDAACNLGGVWQRQRRMREAIAVLERAVQIAPAHARAHNNLGAALIGAGWPDKALPHLKEAIRLRPNFAEALNHLGAALHDMNQNDAAIPLFKEALRIEPDNLSIRISLAHALESVGRIDEAVEMYEGTLQRDPDHCAALFSLTRIACRTHYKLTEKRLRHVEELAERQDLPMEDQYLLHLTLAWVYDHAGDPARAFAHCRLSKEVRLEFERGRGNVFDPQAHAKRIDRMIETFTPEWFARVRSFGSDSELPVFIVGMMRSGTSLAEQILASHPSVYGAGELPDIERMLDGRRARLGIEKDDLESLASLDATTAKSLAEEYLSRLRSMGGAVVRVVDKAPFNYLHLWFIAALFPRARIIHCRRHAVDTCMSAYFQNFAVPHPYTLDLRYLGLFYREYERLMGHWGRVLPVPILKLQYEELTARQEEISRQIVEFCGLEWDERCLRFNETKRVVRTASALQVKQSMYRSSVGKWQRYEEHIGPLLEALGDSIASPTPGPSSEGE